MATFTHGTALPDTANKTDFYATMDTGTVTGIVNADVSNSAAIADSKLAQITTSAKVSISALTGLTGAIIYTLDNGTDAIAASTQLWVSVPFTCTLTGWDLLADVSGAIKIDVWKDTYANYPPTNADTITNAHEPEIAASGTKATDADISDWSSVAVTVGDIVMINVDSCTTIKKCVFVLKYTRP